MFKNIVIGIDGHQGGRDAIALAKRLTDDDATVTLANVYTGEMRRWLRTGDDYESEARERAQQLAQDSRGAFDRDVGVRTIGAPSIGHGLHVIAETVGADLLVVGSSRHGLLGRVLLGDDTRAALNGAPCAIVVAPAGYAAEPGLIREVGVGYNGTAESKHALRVAREIALAHRARLSAFEVVSLPAYLFAGGSAPVDAPIDEMVEEARERIAAIGGVEPHAAYGHPAEELSIYSASLDLLVVGSRDYGPIGRLVHGSTSMQLVRLARCPVLVLTRAARQTEQGDVGGDGDTQLSASAG